MIKKLFISLIVILFSMCSSNAQNPLNNSADNIVGRYSGQYSGEKFQVKIVKLTNGTYRGQMVWIEHDKDDSGNKLLDTKNPDHKLRNTPLDRVVIFSGLKYNPQKKHWGDTKIYDPQRGIKANLTITFDDKGQLRVRGSLMGIGQSVYWKKEN